MEVDVEQSRPRRIHSISHRLLDTILVGKAFRLPKIYDQVSAGKRTTTLSDEVVFIVRIPFRNRNRDGPRRSAACECLCSIDRRYPKFESSHLGTLPKLKLQSKKTIEPRWSIGPVV